MLIIKTYADNYGVKKTVLWNEIKKPSLWVRRLNILISLIIRPKTHYSDYNEYND